ncbi:methyl-accepting chemotaxis protein [Allochromatium vinosum]|uniref:Methyl-accepting chemotaxis sensory transducer n=1 Tax=Allochromatium vinosum (strain ATCC 17899 / DSM 180 / NBRC 103801 / NCIMB 10441 / D) TaxID=572477 RepID=D3RPG3_ALLVD|nr:methyl-accepting chemotaxis protein [Allochromatium vinosum]ADC61545.1 methyl-accepting chemotaxis sensory transducer [Allochromatium vinosum DSM 180]
MFTNLRLWVNYMIGAGTAILLAVSVLSFFNLRALDGLALEAERTELRQYAERIRLDVEAETRLAEAMSALVANIPEVRQHFAAGDRDWLREQLLAPYEVLSKDYGAVQFQFHTPPATSFLRLHQIEKYGDDLAGFRHSVVDTNTQRKPQRGLESGVAGLGARGIVPVFDQGRRHLGSVEFGMSFGPAFFEGFKARHGVEAALHLTRDGQIETFASTAGERPLLDEATIAAAAAGTPQYAQLTIGGVPMAVYAEAIRDYAGQPLGVIEVAKDRQVYSQIRARAIERTWMLGGLVLAIGLVLALVSARVLARRIERLTQGVDRVAAGDLARAVTLDGRDELAGLAGATDRMRRHLRDLVAEVERNAISVHEAARQIAQAVDGQAATSSQMSSSVAEITSTMEELSSSSAQIAEYSGSVVEIARRTYDGSLHGEQAMRQLVDKMEEIRHDNQVSLKEIVDLGGKSKEITRIMEIIDTVADQTKLIAFNAALEASSAGEAGKRFGVVAAEIRRLADSVSESTAEIAHKIGEIQETIGRLVITSEKGSVGIDQGLDASARTADFLRELVQTASETTSSAQQISLSTQQQRTASNQVVVALKEIVTASAETAESVRRISQVAQSMTQLSAMLKGQVDRFVLDERTLESRPTVTEARPLGDA